MALGRFVYWAANTKPGQNLSAAVFTDLTSYTTDIGVRRGRGGTLEDYSAGTATISFDNGTGYFNNKFRLGDAIKVVFDSTTKDSLFVGFIASIGYDEIGGVPVINVTAQDLSTFLGQVEINRTAEDLVAQKQPLHFWLLSETDGSFANLGRSKIPYGYLKTIRPQTPANYEQVVRGVPGKAGEALSIRGLSEFTVLYPGPDYDTGMNLYGGYYVDAVPFGVGEVPMDASKTTGGFTIAGWYRLQEAYTVDEFGDPYSLPTPLFSLGTTRPLIYLSADNGFVGATMFGQDTGDGNLTNFGVGDYMNRGYDTDWHHIAATWEAPTRKLTLFIDGVMVSYADQIDAGGDIISFGTTWSGAPSSKTIKIGSEIGDYFEDTGSGILKHASYITSTIADFQNWMVDDRVWTDAEILSLYEGTAGFRGEASTARLDRLMSYVGTTQYVHDARPHGMAPIAPGATNVLNEAKRIATSISGVFFVDRAGIARVRDEQGLYNQPVTGTIDSEYAEDNLSISIDDGAVANSVTLTKTDGALFTAEDDSSIAEYGVKSLSVEVNLEDDDDALANAKWQVVKGAQPEVWYNDVTVDLTTLPTAYLYDMCRIDLFQIIEVFGKTFCVESIAHDISHDRHLVTFSLSDASVYANYVQFNNGDYGQLDTNRLAY